MENIPRIGDKIINNKIIRTDSVQPPSTSDEIVKSAPESSKNALNDLQNNAQNNTSTEQKEYSLAQFKKDYKHIMRREVFPKLKPYEEKRIKYKSNLDKGVLGVILLVIAYVVWAVLLDYGISIELIFALFGVYAAIRHYFKKKLENEIKVEIMPLLMRAIPGFTWGNGFVSQEETEEADLFPYEPRTNVTPDDNFDGTYRGVKVTICESQYSYTTGSGKGRRTVVIFNGAVVRLKMNKHFEGLTVIRPNWYSSIQNKLEKVELEDVDFHKKFKVFSTDQIESRYLLTTAFMERFKDIMKAFKTERIYCSFYKDYVYIAPYTSKDLFSLAHLSKTLIDEEQYEVLFNEFASILALVDHFKLDKKLGL